MGRCRRLMRVIPLVLLGSAGAAGAAELYPPRVFPVGQEASGIAVADLDRDGILDLVTAHNEAVYGSVLFGNGDRTFAPEVRVQKAGHTAGGVLTVDLDEDGAEDLAIVSGTGISIWLNHGDRTFGDEVSYGSGFDLSIVSADFNRDGHADLAAGSDDFGLVVYPGNGDGTFAPESYVAGAKAHCLLASGDFDGDGLIDLAGHDCSGMGTVLLGHGDGTFAPPIVFPFGGRGVQAWDFDGDGCSDLATVQGEVSIRLATGNGQFAPAVQYAALADASSLGLGDLDGDGDRDLVASGWSIQGDREAAVLLSNGDGSFGAAVNYETPLLGGPVATGDFDRDGRLDVAVASHFGSPGLKAFPAVVDLAFVLAGDGQGGLIGQGVPRFKVGDGPQAIALGDFDGDGNPDLATANSLSNDVSVALGDGHGTFVETGRIPVGVAPTSLVVGKLDAGETQDLAIASRGSSEVSILLGLGDGTFATAPALALGRAPEHLLIADFDGDGVLDLATANPDTDDVSVALGRGDGSFAAPLQVPVVASARWLAVADLDGQTGPDLAVLQGGNVSILLGNGDGTFGAETRFPTGTSVSHSVAAADLDRDGNADLAIAAGGIPSLVVLYGDGQGGFSDPIPLGIEAAGTEVAVADLDSDGRQDLVVTHSEAMVTVLLGAEGGFAQARGYMADEHGGVTIGDLNRDGRLDLAVSGRTWDRVSVLLNQLPPYLRFDSDKDALTWQIRSGVDSYNVYRGDLADLIDVDGDGLVESGYGVCMTALDPDPTDNIFVDAEVPVQGKGFFYLMALVDSEGEHGLGETSAGQPRFPAVSCTPAVERRAASPAGFLGVRRAK